MSPTPLDALFLDGLARIYYAEQRILKALPTYRDVAVSPELRAAFDAHEVETEDHLRRLRKIFTQLDKPAQGQASQAIDGLLLDTERSIATHEGTPALDAALVAGAQALEHYEIALYSALVAWADCLDLRDVADLLDLTLDEEAATDEALSDLADTLINEAALGRV